MVMENLFTLTKHTHYWSAMYICPNSHIHEKDKGPAIIDLYAAIFHFASSRTVSTFICQKSIHINIKYCCYIQYYALICLLSSTSLSSQLVL